MKKFFILAVAVFCLVFAVGCSGQTSGNGNQNQANTASGTNSGNTSGNGASSTTGITLEEAEKAALEHAGVAEKDAVYVTAKPDYEDGRQVYDVEFFSGNTEYDYEIDAATGEVISFDHDIENYTPGGNSTSAEVNVDLETAKSTAFRTAGVEENSVTRLKTELEYDDGQAVYQIEFVKDDMEYDFEISASDGSVLKQEKESVYS